MPDRSNSLIELTIFTKGARLGALTKTIKLVNDKPESDSKDCRMWSGKARRARITDLDGFKAVIENLKPIEAIAIGRMRPKLGNKDIADEVDIVVKRIEAAANSNAVGRAAAIARTAANFTFEPARPALVSSITTPSRCRSPWPKSSPRPGGRPGAAAAAVEAAAAVAVSQARLTMET